jgi:hypothetical protein
MQEHEKLIPQWIAFSNICSSFKTIVKYYFFAKEQFKQVFPPWKTSANIYLLVQKHF